MNTPKVYDSVGSEGGRLLAVGTPVKHDRRGEGVISRFLSGWGPYVPRLYIRRKGAHSFLVIAELERAPDVWRCPDLQIIDSPSSTQQTTEEAASAAPEGTAQCLQP
jgi:hypothetical protein